MKIHLKKFKSGLILLIGLISSCNTEFDKIVPQSPDNFDGIKFNKQKILYLIVDGARGASVKDAGTPNLTNLLTNAIYSWNSISDNGSYVATNWADMLTGVRKEKHQVLDNNPNSGNLNDYPVIIKRIKAIKPAFRVASLSSSNLFKEKFTQEADVSESFNEDDDALTERLRNFVKTDSASLIIGQFSAVQKAGLNAGFDNSFPTYLSAIQKFDQQVGAIMDALKSRADYASENWLVVITSSSGGEHPIPVEQDDKTIFSSPKQNTFTIFYNPSYNQTFVPKPFLGNFYSGKAVRFKGSPNNIRAVAGANESMNYNFGDTSDFTISVKVKKGKTLNTAKGDYYYESPSILGKRNTVGFGGTAGNPGWDICLFQNGWRFLSAGGVGNVNGLGIGGMDFSGDTWHDLTIVVERKADGSRYVRLYTDGVKGVTDQIAGASKTNPIAADIKLPGTPNFDNTAPLRVGYAPGEIVANYGIINVNMAELKIWKAALPEDVIRQFSCDATMEASHPYYPYLIGYWPLLDGEGDKLIDKGPFASNLTLSAGYSWENFNDLICSPSSSNLTSLVPKNSDIPAQILSWFSISSLESWGIDGRVWIPN